MVCHWSRIRPVFSVSAAILVAAGTQPNTVLAREDGRIRLDGRYFQAVDDTGAPVTVVRGLAKPDTTHVLMHRADNGRFISFFGDLHPSFAGNVVKAMGGVKQGWPVVAEAIARLGEPASNESPSEFIARMNDLFRARVEAVNRLTPSIVEVVVRAPQAARNFYPGEFYRLQNFETLAKRIDGTTLAMEGLALTGAWTDKERGLLSTIVLEMGGSSDLCAHLRPGEPVRQSATTLPQAMSPSPLTTAWAWPRVRASSGNKVAWMPP